VNRSLPILRIGSALILLLGPVATVDGAPEGFDIQGHRGARGLAPENTMAAFEKAIELGVTTLELDVVMTLDGVFVVHHDLQLNPKLCTSPSGDTIRRRPLAELDFRDISGLDCGSRRARKFPEQTPSPGERIPRLEEVLDLTTEAPYPVRLSIEIKDSIAKMPKPVEVFVAQLLALVQERGLERRTAIQSTSGAVLVEVRKQEPVLGRALVVKAASAKRWVEDGTATIVSRKHEHLDRSEVEMLQGKGVLVIPWTVNKPQAIEKMIDWGVDGLITDYPDRALALLDDRDH
jgi:glycerophosphoryl diester phosphodiesterase